MGSDNFVLWFFTIRQGINTIIFTIKTLEKFILIIAENIDFSIDDK